MRANAAVFGHLQTWGLPAHRPGGGGETDLSQAAQPGQRELQRALQEYLRCARASSYERQGRYRAFRSWGGLRLPIGSAPLSWAKVGGQPWTQTISQSCLMNYDQASIRPGSRNGQCIHCRYLFAFTLG